MTKESLKKTFLELVAIDSHHPNEDEISAYIEKRFDDVGISWKKDSFGNLFAYIPGSSSSEPVLLSTHIDIPEPAPHVNPIIEGDIIRSDGTSILGADPKTGLAVIIELVCELSLYVIPNGVRTPVLFKSEAIEYKTQSFRAPDGSGSDGIPCLPQAGSTQARDDRGYAPVELLLTRGEEKGLLGALHADYSLLTAKIGFVLDEDGPVNQVTVKAPGYVRFDASFIGKVVHTREPEKGINALQVFCHAVRDLSWGHSCEGVSWNIGQFQAGTARNSVPGHASVHAELRSFDTATLQKEAQRIEEQFCETAQSYGATCEVKRDFLFEGYDVDRSHPLFARMKTVYDTMGLAPQFHETFGGSDVNVFIAKGITALTLGSGYYNAHEYTEYASISDMVQIYEFLEKFLKN